MSGGVRGVSPRHKKFQKITEIGTLKKSPIAFLEHTWHAKNEYHLLNFWLPGMQK